MGYVDLVKGLNAETALTHKQFLDLPRNKQAAYLKKYPNSSFRRKGPGGKAQRALDTKALKKKPTDSYKATDDDKIAKLKEEIRHLKSEIKKNTASISGKVTVSAKRVAEIKKYIEHLKEGVAKASGKIIALNVLAKHKSRAAKKKKAKETASRKYYILVEWVPSSNRWSMEFGDYDQQLVKEEMVSHKDSGSKTKNMRVVALDDDGQKSIDAFMRGLNQEEPNGPTKK